jgi:hypothetical protein
MVICAIVSERLRFLCQSGFAAIVFGAGLLLATSASASPITWHYTGLVASNSTVYGVLVNGPRVVSGTITFESGIADAAPLDPMNGSYLSPDGAPYGFTFEVPSLDISVARTVAMQQMVRNGANDVITLSADFSGPVFFPYFELSVIGDGSLITGDNQSLVPPDFSLFSATDFIFGESSQAIVFGRLTSLTAVTPATVPEPTSLLLLGTGIAGLIAKARRRKKQKVQ